jgi:ribose transport system substrate-binding protein
MQDLLQAHSDLKVVYAHNDDMAVGASQVLREAGRNEVVVAGIDGLSQALKIIKSGGQYIATALNDPRHLGDVTIQTAREVAAKRSVPTFIDAGTTLVTSANVGPFDLSVLFASYRPKIFSEAK